MFVRLRTPIGLLMPATAAVLVGIVIGTYVVAPMAEPGLSAATRRPAASARAVASGPAAGASDATAAGTTDRPATSAAGSRVPGSAGKPASPITPGTSAGAGAPAPAATAPGTSAASFPAAKEGTVPILYYHRVEALPGGFAGWSKRSQDSFLLDDTLPFAFVAQLDWLVAHGYTTILPRDLAAHWDSGTPLPKRPVILTFDDGFRNWRSFVLPELKKRHMVAEFYVVVQNVGRSISWDDVKTLAAAGMGIGGHDMLHFQLAGGGVPTASPGVMRYQVTEAKRRLELKTGAKVDSMAYVGGGFNGTLMAIVEGAGYTSARGIERGVQQVPANRYHLHVSRIGWRDDVTDVYNGRMTAGLPTFAKRMSGKNPG